MSEKVKVEIQFFGGLKSICPDSKMEIKVPAGSKLSDLKQELVLYFSMMGVSPEIIHVLERSAWADDVQILQASDPVQGGKRLAVLLPVSGG